MYNFVSLNWALYNMDYARYDIFSRKPSFQGLLEGARVGSARAAGHSESGRPNSFGYDYFHSDYYSDITISSDEKFSENAAVKR